MLLAMNGFRLVFNHASLPGLDRREAEMNDTMQLRHVKEHLVGMDVRDADTMHAKVAETKRERLAFEGKFRGLRKVAESAQAAAASSSSARRGRAPPQAKRVPRKLPRKDDETLATWNKLPPEGARIVQDDFNSRFLCWYRKRSVQIVDIAWRPAGVGAVVGVGLGRGRPFRTGLPHRGLVAGRAVGGAGAMSPHPPPASFAPGSILASLAAPVDRREHDYRSLLSATQGSPDCDSEMPSFRACEAFSPMRCGRPLAIHAQCCVSYRIGHSAVRQTIAVQLSIPGGLPYAKSRWCHPEPPLLGG